MDDKTTTTACERGCRGGLLLANPDSPPAQRDWVPCACAAGQRVVETRMLYAAIEHLNEQVERCDAQNIKCSDRAVIAAAVSLAESRLTALYPQG